MSKILILLLGFVSGYAFNSFIGTQKSEIIPKKDSKVTLKKIVKIKPIVTIIDSIKIVDKYTPQNLLNSSLEYIEQENYPQAIGSLENLLTQVQDKYPQKYIEDIFVNTVNSYLSQIGDNKPLKKIDIIENALNFLPNNLNYHLILAQLFLTLEDYDSANYQASFLNYQSNWKQAFDKIISQINYAKVFKQGDIKIPLYKKSNSWHIKVQIDGVLANFIVDTGASITTISEHLVGANYSKLSTITLSTANGKIKSYTVKIKNFAIGGFIENELKVAVLPQKVLPQNIDGLLGLDWLEQFYFVIDAQNSSLNLTKKY